MASTNGFNVTELFKAQVHLYNHIFSLIRPMTLKWVTDLGIPDIIHNHGKPITLPELVSALSVPQEKAICVQRVMRLLAHNEFFKVIKINDNEEEKEAYVLTPASKLLVKGSDVCLSSMVTLMTDPMTVGSFCHLGKWIRGKELTMIETIYGSGFWEYNSQNPAVMRIFNEAMESDSNIVKLALQDCKSVFESLNSLVDVGGGTGNTAKIICDTFPKLECIVFDLPNVVENLSGSNNISYVGGNMFESIPQADAVLLKLVLHNWNDNDCIKILKKCKEAVSGKGKGGKVIIVDAVSDEKQDNHEMTETKLFFDILMMALHNGEERDEKKWKQLFSEAGFKHYKIHLKFGFRSLIELYP